MPHITGTNGKKITVHYLLGWPKQVELKLPGLKRFRFEREAFDQIPGIEIVRFFLRINKSNVYYKLHEAIKQRSLLQ